MVTSSRLVLFASRPLTLPLDPDFLLTLISDLGESRRATMTSRATFKRGGRDCNLQALTLHSILRLLSSLFHCLTDSLPSPLSRRRICIHLCTTHRAAVYNVSSSFSVRRPSTASLVIIFIITLKTVTIIRVGRLSTKRTRTP